MPASTEIKKMTSLYQLTAQYRELANTLADSDFDAATVADTIEASGLDDDIQQKAQSLEYVARTLEADKPAMLAEIERLQARIASRDKAAQGLRDYLLSSMRAMEKDKIETPMFTFQVRKNPPAVEIADPDALPPQFWRTPEPKPPVAAPDKAAIKAALQAGAEVPGAKLVQGVKLAVK